MSKKKQVEFEDAPEDWIFALDVGTRTIIGVVGTEHNGHFTVLAATVLEHVQRAMLDGQVHDIGRVVDGAAQVKKILEDKLKHRLRNVAIAAAGRVLKTSQVHVSREADDSKGIDAQTVGALEMEGVRMAQDVLFADAAKDDRSLFHCVGYSVIHYYLDNYKMTNLLSHKGRVVSLDLLATFLPHMVIDSLYTVMERIGLTVVSMTLEPIAALNVAIPNDLRLLNLALVDIGAGTSDIAITKGGSVISYAMAPIAGDELTEAIAQNYLLDFNMAEKMKLDACNHNENVQFTDILDNHMTVASDEVFAVMAPVIAELAQTVSTKILESNAGKAPNAVFLVGGGSQVKGLAAQIAELLGLPAERVAVRNRSIAKNVTFQEDILTGPECITPLGIMVTAAQQAGKDFFHVTVGEQKIRLFQAKKMAVADALLSAGYVPDQLIGKSGATVRFLLNGVEKSVRGESGTAAEISLNGEACGLMTEVHAGDHILVKTATRGKDAAPRVGDYLHTVQPVTLVHPDGTLEFPNVAVLNGEALNGMPLNGVVQSGAALNGEAQNGMPLNGVVQNGAALNVAVLNGRPLNGVVQNGAALNGEALNGMPLNGVVQSGAALNGEAFTRKAIHGTVFPGIREMFEIRIGNGDALTVCLPGSLREMLTMAEIDGENHSFFKNGQTIAIDTPLSEGDKIVCMPKHNVETPQLEDSGREVSLMVAMEGMKASTGDTFMDKKGSSLSQTDKPTENKFSATGDTALQRIQEKDQSVSPVPKKDVDSAFGSNDKFIYVNDEKICIANWKNDMMFVDIFTYCAFDLTTPKGTVVLKRNGFDAGFTDILAEQDHLEIYWNE